MKRHIFHWQPCCLIFSVFLYRFAKMSEHTLIDSLKLRYENKSLLEYLESSNKKLTDTTQKYIQLNTELTKMRDEALGLARAKSEFLATMSHEIRTPMNGVLGMIELLLGTRLSEQQQRFAETVRRSGETLLSIINNILDFSKIEAGKLSLEQADFNLRDLVEDLGELFSARAHGKGLELACSVPGDIPEAMMGDATRLRQVLTNLIGNAIKFTETGEVLISVQALEETATAVRVRFAIKDTGIGLESSQIEHIFDSFAQGDGSTTRKYGGTGLGLAISRQLVDLMGGQLDVESVAGQGSTFSFELDLEKQQTPRPRVPPGQSMIFPNCMCSWSMTMQPIWRFSLITLRHGISVTPALKAEPLRCSYCMRQLPRIIPITWSSWITTCRRWMAWNWRGRSVQIRYCPA